MKDCNQPLFSVVILNWNGSKYVFKCLESVANQSYSNIEVVFVDNASTDGSYEQCKLRYPNCVFVKNEINMGFTGGMNCGIENSNGKYILLLNTDVYLESHYVESCVSLLERHPDVYCTAGWEYKWRNFELTNEKVSGGLGILLHLRFRTTHKNFDDVFGVTGSFPVFRKTCIDDIRSIRGFFFDEAFQTGWEDTEIRFFMYFLGLKTMLNTETKAWHVGSASDNENERLLDKNSGYQIRIFRNRLFIIDRYIKGRYWGWYTYLCFINFALSVYLYFFKRESYVLMKKAKSEFNSNKAYLEEQRALVSSNIKNNRMSIFKYCIGL